MASAPEPGPLRAIEQLGRGVLDAFFPMRCGLCGLAASQGICGACAEEIGTPQLAWSRAPEADALSESLALFPYTGRVAQAVQRLKYERTTSLAEPMAELMARAFQASGHGPFDLVLPVPIHWRRLFWRGFNQAELLAAKLIRPETSPAGGTRSLLRTRATRPQVGLSPAERQKNIANAFRAGDAVQGQSVLLVDDVLTTGATARACADALRKAGASHVGLLTFASGTVDQER